VSTVQLRRLALVVAVLLVLWGLSTLFGHRSDQTRGALTLPNVPATTTDTVTISHGRDTVHLVQTAPSVWTANGYPATPGYGNDLVRAIDDTAPREIAALSASSFARLGVDSTAWTLRVGPGAHPRLTLLVGTQGGEFNTGYVRVPGSDTVYLWRGTLPSQVRRQAEAWRDHHLASIPADSIQAIDVTQHGKRYVVRRDSKGWMVEAARADSLKVRVLLAQFANLSVQGFGGAATADSLARAGKRVQRTITVRGKGPTPLLSLTLDSAGAGSFWATRAGDRNLYQLASWQVAQLTPLADSLMARH